MMRSLYGILETDDPSAARHKVAAAFALRYPELIDAFLGRTARLHRAFRTRIGLASRLDADSRIARVNEFLEAGLAAVARVTT